MGLQKQQPENQAKSLGLVMIGSAKRLAIAIAITFALWAGFFWAITSPGSL